MSVFIASGKQKGVALAFCLILLMIATLLGISAMQMAHLEERIASNQRQITDAFMAAETGVVEALKCLRDDNPNDWGNESGICAGLSENGTRDVGWRIVSITYDNDVAAILSRGWVGQTETAMREVLAHIERSDGGATLDLGDETIGSRQNLQSDGNLHLYGSVHANGDIQSDGESNYLHEGATVSTAEDDIELEGAEGEMLVNQPEQEIPRPTELLAEMNTSSRESPNQYYNDDCELTLEGDYSGTLIYCNGNVEIAGGPFWNVTIAAGNGNIEHSGESTAFHPETGDRVEPPAFVASQNIYVWGIPGSRNSRVDGIYWSGIDSGNVVFEDKYWDDRAFTVWGNIRADNFQATSEGDFAIHPLGETANRHLGAEPGDGGTRLLAWSEVIE